MSAIATAVQGLRVPTAAGPRLTDLPVCPKCQGSGGYEYTPGQQGRCTRCTDGRMTGKDISRYMAWSTEGYRVVESRLIVEAHTPNGGKVRSIRSVNRDTLVFAHRGGKWTALKERDLVVNDWVLIPKRGTAELMVCRLVEVEPVRRRKYADPHLIDSYDARGFRAPGVGRDPYRSGPGRQE
jgi:hypothetical protein